MAPNPMSVGYFQSVKAKEEAYISTLTKAAMCIFMRNRNLYEEWNPLVYLK